MIFLFKSVNVERGSLHSLDSNISGLISLIYLLVRLLLYYHVLAEERDVAAIAAID